MPTPLKKVNLPSNPPQSTLIWACSTFLVETLTDKHIVTRSGLKIDPQNWTLGLGCVYILRALDHLAKGRGVCVCE